ncbi:sel1 repeat family protein [Herbaspirillum lusitanum]|uniref:tetratricopeptide repeat protein n=1 Tax=Herbaspirillum lusitanum TaxID=213312 RepID=UPI0022387A44|nr:tetratricopeptide repeat protein [Herbaspirillum lusitanum]MCW5300259.1 sel1 repeat family protein [Herbaspirillum lusitanum]
MKKMSSRAPLLMALLFASGMAGAAETAAAAKAKSGGAKQAPVEMSVMRVLCEGKYADAQVSVNGVLKGECPIDMEVRPGLIQIRATKKRDDYYDQVFEQSFTLGSGVAKRVEVVFNKRPQFRPEAIARADKAVEASEIAMEARRRSEIPVLENAAASGDGAAMARLGAFCRNGLAGPVDLKKSSDWYKKAADAGNAEGMYEYALQSERGYLAPKNMALAVELYQKSAALGEPRALEKIGRFMEKGSDGFQKNPRLAVTYYAKAAEAGNKRASLMYWAALPEAEQDAALATEEKLATAATRIQLRKAEAGEDFDALTDAAATYTFGTYGNAVNPERALTYYRMALRQKKKQAAAGDAQTSYQLGYWYAEGGIGLSADRNEAIRYYKQAQLQGYPDAAEALSKLQSQ